MSPPTLLSLPAELRLRVYELVLNPADKVEITGRGRKAFVHTSAWPLLLSSRRVYDEAISLYYRSTTFLAADLTFLSRCNDWCPAGFLSHARRLHLRSKKWHVDLTGLTNFPALREIKVEIVDQWLFERPFAKPGDALNHSALKEALELLTRHRQGSGETQASILTPFDAVSLESVPRIGINFGYEYKHYYLDEDTYDEHNFCWCWTKMRLTYWVQNDVFEVVDKKGSRNIEAP